MRTRTSGRTLIVYVVDDMSISAVTPGCRGDFSFTFGVVSSGSVDERDAKGHCRGITGPQ
jgi:hypothetical protein